MDFNGIEEIVNLLDNSSISYFEYSTADGHIKIDKSLSRAQQSGKVVSNEPAVSSDTEAIANASSVVKEMVQEKSQSPAPNVQDEDLKIVTSPMVGTFYEAASAEKPSFVKLGDNVNKGDTLCIIEAMKLMNEIESDFTGTIAEILVKNGDMVEYGQPLFKIKEN